MVILLGHAVVEDRTAGSKVILALRSPSNPAASLHSLILATIEEKDERYIAEVLT